MPEVSLCRRSKIERSTGSRVKHSYCSHSHTPDQRPAGTATRDKLCVNSNTHTHTSAPRAPPRRAQVRESSCRSIRPAAQHTHLSCSEGKWVGSPLCGCCAGVTGVAVWGDDAGWRKGGVAGERTCRAKALAVRSGPTRGSPRACGARRQEVQRGRVRARGVGQLGCTCPRTELMHESN